MRNNFYFQLRGYSKNSALIIIVVCCFFCLSFPSKSTELLWVSPALNHDHRSRLDVSSMLLIQKYLKDTSFIRVTANVSRTFKILNTESDACTGNMLKTQDRQSRFYMTNLPQVIAVGLRLYVVKGSAIDTILAAQTADNAKVDLEWLLKLTAFKSIGIADGRSYGEYLDKALANHAVASKIWVRHGSDVFSGSLKMLTQKRMQALIEYPTAVSFYTNSIPASINLNSYALKGATAFNLGYIMCSRTKNGLKLTQMLDETLNKLSHTREFYQLQLKWNSQVPEQEFNRLYKKIYDLDTK